MTYMEEYMQRMLFLMDFHIERFKDQKMPVCHITKGFFEYKNLNMCFVNDMVARIAEALYRGYLPVVEVPGGEGLPNLWGAFFKQPYEILGIDYETYAAKAEHFNEIDPVWGPGYKANLIPRELMCATNLYRELVVLNETSRSYVDKEVDEILGDKTLLGVLVRGTDLGKQHPMDHPRQPQLERVAYDIAEELKTGIYDGIYLASDDEEVEEFISKNLPGVKLFTNKRHYLNDLYNSATPGEDTIYLTDLMEEQKTDYYAFGMEYLSSIFLLSKCESLIAGNTLGSSAALFLNGNKYCKHLLYDLGFYGENREAALIFVKGAIEALDYFTDQLIEGAEELAHPYYVIDITNPATYGPGLDDFVANHSCIAVMFNQIGILLEDSPGVNYWDAKGIPVFSMQVDHPRNFADAMLSPIQMLHVLSIDRNHMGFIRRFYPEVKRNFFLPNGGTTAKGVVEKELASFENRSIDVLILGDCQQPVPQFPPITAFEDQGTGFYESVIHTMLSDSKLTTEEAIEKFFEDNQIPVSDEVLREFYTSVSIYIETFIRREWKQRMIRTLSEAGISMEIYGNNWEDSSYPLNPNIHIHPRIPSEECGHKMADAKIMINCMPWYKRGSSERPFNTMLNKSLCFMDESEYLLERFKDGENICFFDIEKLKELAEKIKYYLSHPEEAQSIIDKGFEIVSKEDTWKERLKTILFM